MANPLTKFTVTAKSRHPKNNRGYDHKTHTYRAGYVKPSAWRLTLSACAQLPTEVLVEPPSPTEEEDGGDHKPDVTEVPVIPPDVEKYEWTVEQVPSGFKKVFGAQPPLCDATVDVPAPGTYRITLTIRKRGGSFLRSDPTLYRLRDALVVSLGESAASGQGNPDVPGEPTLLGSGQCELTTLSAIIDGLGLGVSMDREPTWQEPLAYRSYLSGPSRAALALEDRRAGKVVTFLSFASSGAEIENGLFQPQTRLPRRRSDRGGQTDRRRPPDRRTAALDRRQRRQLRARPQRTGQGLRRQGPRRHVRGDQRTRSICSPGSTGCWRNGSRTG